MPSYQFRWRAILRIFHSTRKELLQWYLEINEGQVAHTQAKTEPASFWHANEWWKNPYTALRLQLGTSTTAWTRNAIGDHWLVKTTKVDNKDWWTVVEKHPKISGRPGNR